MRPVMGFLVFVAVLLAAGTAAGDEELLREAWARRPGPKAALLETAGRRFENLVARWPAKPGKAEGLDSDADVQWLLEQGQAAYLVLDKGFSEHPTGKRRSVLLFLAGRLHRRNLGQYMPDLLAASVTGGEWLEALQCMSGLQDPQSLRCMQSFLMDPPQGATEEQLTEAARGLGISGRPECLEGINAARPRAESPKARFEFAKAAWRCGDESALAEVAEVLEAPEPDAMMQADAIAFLCQNFNDGALERLVRFASATKNEELATAAMWAVINGSSYGRNLPDGPADDKGEPPVQASAEPAEDPSAERKASGPDTAPVMVLPGLPPNIAELSPEERKQLIDEIAAWWLQEGRSLKAKKQRGSDVS